jgi:hypothetical protein
MFQVSAQPEARVPWSGWYQQGASRHPVRFDQFNVDPTGRINGQGQDEVGSFSIAGCIYPNACFEFNKTYMGAHTVAYKGNLQSGRLTGRWSLNGMSDEFEINYQVEQWSGSFQTNGQQIPMKVHLFVDPSGVFSLGKDGEGVYVIKGSYNPGSAQLTFIKYYIGKYQIQYQGSVFNDSRFLIITGNWQTNTGMNGSFEVFKPLGPNDNSLTIFQPPAPPQNFQPVFFGLPQTQIPPQYQQQPQFAMNFGYGAPPPVPQPMPGQYFMQPQTMAGQQYYNNYAQQPQAPAAQTGLTGFLESYDLMDGGRDDIQRLVDKIRRGKKLKGENLAFIGLIKQEVDVVLFVNTAVQYGITELKLQNLIDAIKKCKFQNKMKDIAYAIFPLITPRPGAIECEKVLDCFVFDNDRQDVATKLNIMV